jgi:secreted trypsin-like serine protease
MHILFAAHCVQDKNQKWTKHALDSYFYFKNDYDTDDDDDYDDPENVNVAQFIIHPDWDPEDEHYTADIAIAVLKQPIELSNEIRHVCLNTPADPIRNFAGRSGKVFGWGLTEELKTVSKLRHVDVPLVDQALCNSSDLRLHKIMSDTSFCAGTTDGKTGACNGN